MDFLIERFFSYHQMCSMWDFFLHFVRFACFSNLPPALLPFLFFFEPVMAVLFQSCWFQDPGQAHRSPFFCRIEISLNYSEVPSNAWRKVERRIQEESIILPFSLHSPDTPWGLVPWRAKQFLILLRKAVGHSEMVNGRLALTELGKHSNIPLSCLWLNPLSGSSFLAQAGEAPSPFPYANDFIKASWWNVMWWVLFLRWNRDITNCAMERCQKRESLAALTSTSKK